MRNSQLLWVEVYGQAEFLREQGRISLCRNRPSALRQFVNSQPLLTWDVPYVPSLVIPDIQVDLFKQP